MPVIKPGDFSDDRVKALLTRHLEGMYASSPPGHVFALDWSGLQKPEISFYALWEGEEILGVGALKELEPRAGEIKSMRTADAHLRRGVAATILDHIIAEARRRGYTRLSLETGSGPAFEPRSRRAPLINSYILIWGRLTPDHGGQSLSNNAAGSTWRRPGPDSHCSASWPRSSQTASGLWPRSRMVFWLLIG